jgi:hypothetical protein
MLITKTTALVPNNYKLLSGRAQLYVIQRLAYREQLCEGKQSKLFNNKLNVI